jgi:hypothetical protein
VSLEQNGYRLEQSWRTGRITVSDPTGQLVLSFDGWSLPVGDPSFRYDPATRAITLAHPNDGAPLITLTMDQWQEANEAVWAAETTTTPQASAESILIFTTDGETWSATAPEWLGVDPNIGTHGPILVEDDRVLALGLTAGDRPTITLWEGTLPG